MIITRRQFLKYCSVAAGALGLSAGALFKLKETIAKEGGLQIMWLNAATCSGCSTSFLNSIYYATIQELLLSGPATQSLDLQYHPTLMAASGTLATDAATLSSLNDPFVLVVEGSIQTGTPYGGSQGDYCHVGNLTGGPKLMDVVTTYATSPKCGYILAVGTCAAFGGIPAGDPNPTGAKGLLDYFDTGAQTWPTSGEYYHSDTWRSIRNKTINIPGCPPNPNWIAGTIAYIINHGVGSMPPLDSLRRPRMYYGERICNHCDRFNDTNFIDNMKPDEIGDPNKRTYCLKNIGCKGSRTKADCSWRKWHSPDYSEVGINWCVGAGAPCQGCTQDGFPDRMSPFYYIR